MFRVKVLASYLVNKMGFYGEAALKKLFLDYCTYIIFLSN